MHDRAVDRFLARDRIGDLQDFKPVGADGHVLSPSKRPRRFGVDRPAAFFLELRLHAGRNQRLRLSACARAAKAARSAARTLSVLRPASSSLAVSSCVRACRRAATRGSAPRSASAWPRRDRASGSARSFLRPARASLRSSGSIGVAAVALDADDNARESACGRSRSAASVRSRASWPIGAAKIRDAHQRPVDAGRGNLQPIFARRSTSSTSSSGESAWLAASQSSMVMVPSGRSAMICSVVPFCCEQLHAHEPDSRAAPAPARRDARCARRRPSRRRDAARRAGRASAMATGVSVKRWSWFARVSADQTKKSGSPAGPHSQAAIIRE